MSEVYNKQNKSDKEKKEKENIEKGNRGEKLVSICLGKLGGSYRVLNGVYVSDGVKVTQIDHIVIGQKKIFHIETKTWAGRFNIPDRGCWDHISSGTKTKDDPIAQTQRHESFLKRFFGTIKDYKGINIQGIVVMADIDCTFNRNERDGIPILKPEDLIAYILEKNNSSPEPGCVYDIDVLYNDLKSYSSKHKVWYFIDPVIDVFKYIGKSIANLLVFIGKRCLSIFKAIFSLKVLVPVFILVAVCAVTYYFCLLPNVSNNLFVYRKDHSGTILYNRAYERPDHILFGHTKYKKGISAVLDNNSSASITLKLNVNGYNLKRKVFEGLISVDNNCYWVEESKARVEVYHYDKLLYTTKAIAPWEKPEVLSVDVEGRDEIKVVFYYDNPIKSKICVAIVDPYLR